MPDAGALDISYIVLYCYILTVDRTLHAFHLDTDLADGLTALKTERGIPKSEQVRRAIRMWLESEGILKPKKRPRTKGGRKTR